MSTAEEKTNGTSREGQEPGAAPAPDRKKKPGDQAEAQGGTIEGKAVQPAAGGKRPGEEGQGDLFPPGAEPIGKLNTETGERGKPGKPELELY